MKSLEIHRLKKTKQIYFSVLKTLKSFSQHWTLLLNATSRGAASWNREFIYNKLISSSIGSWLPKVNLLLQSFPSPPPGNRPTTEIPTNTSSFVHHFTRMDSKNKLIRMNLIRVGYLEAGDKSKERKHWNELRRQKDFPGKLLTIARQNNFRDLFENAPMGNPLIMLWPVQFLRQYKINCKRAVLLQY